MTGRSRNRRMKPDQLSEQQLARKVSGGAPLPDVDLFRSSQSQPNEGQ